MITETNTLPDSYPEAIIAHWNLSKQLRKTITSECAAAIAAEDEALVNVLTAADDDVRAAQQLLARAAARISEHHVSHYNFPP